RHTRSKRDWSSDVCSSDLNKDKSKAEQIDYYTEEDLKKLAFWNATGSGKTLIMHINILQYLHYFYQTNRHSDLEQIILITPSDDSEERRVGNEYRGQMTSR